MVIYQHIYKLMAVVAGEVYRTMTSIFEMKSVCSGGIKSLWLCYIKSTQELDV